MIELPDDELDKLFRKSAEELDPKFEPEDWDNLKKRLDQQDGRTAASWFRKWWPLGLLALLIPVGFVAYVLMGNAEKEIVGKDKKIVSEVASATAPPEKRTSVVTKRQMKNPASSVNAEVRESKASASHEKISRKEGIVKFSSKPNVETAAQKGRKLLPRSRSKAGGVYLEPNRSKGEGGDGALSFEVTEVRKNDPSGTNAAKLGARPAIGSNGVASKQAVSGINTNVIAETAPGISELEKKVVEEEAGRMQFAANNLANNPLSWHNAIPYPAVKADSVNIVSQQADADKGQDEIVESPKWAIRLGYSPDLTTVGFQNFTKPGTAFSLLGEYGLTKRLYVQVGVVRTEKDYYAPGSEYKFKNYVTSINTPDSLDGVCLMYEIPLGIRFDFVQKAHSRLFFGTGFSSYYIQKEEYKYYYKDYVHGQKPYWKGKSGLTLFSHLNASVGYERTITRKLSILAEPYIRIPLKGVGYGKVNLTTMGMWLSLRYTPAFR
jgi:hypothetical protein